MMLQEVNSKCGDWILDRNLGSGGFGIVECWRNSQTGAKIAIKKCKDASNLSEKQKERWNHEVVIMKHIRHPNLVTSVFLPAEIKAIQGPEPVLCMEYCNKGDLRKFLNDPKNACGLDQLKAIKIMSDISSGVEFLHQNKITHRDLKPENIVLHEKNGKIAYKLIDLGYAKELGQDSLYASLVGTLNYVAPELFWNKKYSCSVDYWSLGILFYEILTGTRPFLPHMKHTMTWMNAVQNKAYEEICAQQINSEINFYPYIADPTVLSESIEKEIVEWFRIALQWDPKKRGKLPYSNEVTLFNMWKKISTKQELQVFLTFQYRIITFPLEEESTLENLQEWISSKTEMPTDQQIIADFQGRLLDNKKPLILQIDIEAEDPHIIVFKTGNVHFEKFPEQQLPKPIERVLLNPNEAYDYHERIQYIKAVMFFINQEIKISKWYQIALSIKIDLLDNTFMTLEENLKSAVESISSLKSVMEESFKKVENQISQNQNNAYYAVIRKMEDKPLKAVTQMTKKIELLKTVNQELRNLSDINWTHDLSALFDKTVEALNKEDNTVRKAYIHSTTKIFSRFLELRCSNIERNEEIIETTRKIAYLEEELSKLDKFLNSANILKTIYSKEFEDLKSSHAISSSHVLCESKANSESGISNIPSSSNNSSNPSLNNKSETESDKLIRDNLVLRHMVTNLVDKLQKEGSKFLNLDL